MSFGVSIIIPNFNHARYLEESLDSAIHQTRQPDEILVCDDASTDNSRKIIEEYATRCPLVKPVFLEQNKGVIFALNTLLSRAKGDWILPASSDDSLNTDLLKNLFDAMEAASDFGVVFAKTMTMDEQGRPLHYTDYSTRPYWTRSMRFSGREFVEEYIMKKPAFVGLSTAVLFHRERLQAMGGYSENMKWWADAYLLEAMGMKYGALYVNCTGSHVRTAVAGFSRSPNVRIAEYMEIMSLVSRSYEKLFSDLGLERRYISDWIKNASALIVNRECAYKFRKLLENVDGQIENNIGDFPSVARLGIRFLKRIHKMVFEALLAVIAGATAWQISRRMSRKKA